jgi:predicted GH43/DUF377 family glycosyl hydrolase
MPTITRKKSIPGIVPVGVISNREVSGIFVRELEEVNSKFYILWSEDRAHYDLKSREVVFKTQDGKKENPRTCSNFKFTESDEGWTATYIRSEPKKKYLVIATSADSYAWLVRGTLEVETTDADLITASDTLSKNVIYYGGLFFKHATSSDLKTWDKHGELLLTSRAGKFDSVPLQIIGAAEREQGLYVFYDASKREGDMTKLQAGLAIFSKDNPGQVTWRSDIPLWKAMVNTHGETLKPLGIVSFSTQAILFWASEEGSIISSVIIIPGVPGFVPKSKLYLRKHHDNPIITPQSENEWETEAVFNPAAIYDNDKVHLLYRAVGRSGISVIGYASSEDGLNFNRRLNYPVYEPGEGYADTRAANDMFPKEYNPLIYTSGGGWNGFEDPRTVKIDDYIYMSYLEFGGWGSMRMAITAIHADDFNSGTWRWMEPKHISPPGQIHKNWVLFPEKINGKFAILHAISPKILVHYADSLSEFDGETYIKSQAPSGGRREYWDSKVRGAGPPPIRTKLGWLLLYHANDMQDMSKYKLGAMILDNNDPGKILYRTSHPIMIPDMPYENEGKPGIVYASGAVVIGDDLYVYYGGGDRVVCVATVKLDEFLANIVRDSTTKLKTYSSLLA